MKSRVAVIGSINIDVQLALDHFPVAGQTVFAKDTRYFPGGKGANQAVSVARMGTPVSMIGSIGDDAFGEMMFDFLQNEGIDVSHIVKRQATATGMAVVMLQAQGENSIIITPGANALLLPKDIDQASAVFDAVDIVLLQMEIPLNTVMYAAALAKERNKIVLLDPSPVPTEKLPEKLIRSVDIVLPNRSEASSMSGRKISDMNEARLAASDLLEMGFRKVIVKLDRAGVLLAENNRFFEVPAHPVTVVDTTAAGDAFAGALSASLIEGNTLRAAVEFANAVGALTTQRLGAMSSIPNREQVDRGYLI